MPGTCGTGRDVLGKDCGSRDTGKQQEGCCAFSHFPAFWEDAGLWGMLAVQHLPQKTKAWGKDIEAEPGCCQSLFSGQEDGRDLWVGPVGSWCFRI